MEFRILGPLEVADDGRAVAIRRGKEQALLAYLLLHANEVVPSGRLIDVLWDGRPPPTASKILHNAVSHLRRDLGDGRLLTRDPGYVLRVERGELDALEFERLAKEGRSEEALALWRGLPLVDLQNEAFADDARRRYEELRLGAIEDRIDDDLAAGRHAEVIPELEQLIQEHPLRERLRGQLMLALYGAGRQADALEAYRAARRTLSDELGLEPGRELQELERKILKQELKVAQPRARRGPARPASGGRRWWPIAAVIAALIIAGAVVAALTATGSNGKPIVATPNSLAVVDSDSNRVVADIPIGGTPRGVTVGARYVWAANAGEGTVSRIDPETLTTRTIGLGASATDLIEKDGIVWVVTGSDDTLVAIDARTGGILDSSPLSRGDLTASAYTIAGAPDGIWVGSGNDLFKVDPSTRRPVFKWHYSGGVNDIALSGSSLWLVSSDETVARLSATAPRETAQTGIGVIPTALAIANGSVWVAASAPYSSQSALWRLDGVTARVSQVITFGSAGLPPLSEEVAAGEGSLWVATYDGDLYRVDARDGSKQARIHIGGHLSGVAVGKGRVWVTVS